MPKFVISARFPGLGSNPVSLAFPELWISFIFDRLAQDHRCVECGIRPAYRRFISDCKGLLETVMADILIVDDNAAFRKMLKHILLSKFPSKRIREAVDGNRAIKETQKQAPNLIFMDVRLPGENGFQLTKRIKAAYPEVVVIMMTSCDSPEYREAAFESGADFFVSKNASTAADILERVESIFSPN